MGDRQLVSIINTLWHSIDDKSELGIIVGYGIIYGALHPAANTPHTETEDIHEVQNSLEEVIHLLGQYDWEAAPVITDLSARVEQRLEAYTQAPNKYDDSLIEQILPSNHTRRKITPEDIKRAGLHVINKALTQGVRNERSVSGEDFATIVYGFSRYWRKRR